MGIPPAPRFSPGSVSTATISPRLFVSLNGAFLPFEGLAGMTFPVLAKMLFLNPFAPRLFAWAADHAAVANLLLGTGSKIEPRGVELYARLMRNPAHCAGALGMMANWNLETLAGDLKRLTVRTVLVVGQEDKAVPPGDANKVAALIPHASVERLPGLGHLAHEERPDAGREADPVLPPAQARRDHSALTLHSACESMKLTHIVSSYVDS